MLADVISLVHNAAMRSVVSARRARLHGDLMSSCRLQTLADDYTVLCCAVLWSELAATISA